MSDAVGSTSSGGRPTDAAVWLRERIACASALLDRLASSQRFHARVLSQELGHHYDADRRSIHELLAEPARGRRAEVRDIVRRHVVAAEASGRIVVTVGNLLAAEHADASRCCDEIAAATEGFDDDDLRAVTPLLRNAVSILAQAMLGALELRVLAERLDHTDRAALLACERDRWASLAARLSIAAVTGGLELDPPPGPATPAARTDASAARPRSEVTAPVRAERSALPLVGRVVLALAEGGEARARIAAVIERAGATAVFVHTRAAALELLRWFQVDAIVAVIERGSGTLLHLPHALEHTPGHRPLCVALVLPAAAAASAAAGSFGYDAVIPLTTSDGGSVVEMLGAAIQARGGRAAVIR